MFFETNIGMWSTPTTFIMLIKFDNIAIIIALVGNTETIVSSYSASIYITFELYQLVDSNMICIPGKIQQSVFYPFIKPDMVPLSRCRFLHKFFQIILRSEDALACSW